MLTKKQAWRFIAESFVTQVRIKGDIFMSPLYSTGICRRIDCLYNHGKISRETREQMSKEIDKHLAGGVFIYPSAHYFPTRDADARSLGCLLLAEAGL